VTGDLTTAFDFAKPHGRAKPRLPSTLAFLPPDLVRHDDLVVVSPPHPSLPEQEPGVRPARPLPYELHAHGSVSAVDGSFVIAFDNSGGAGAVFHVRDLATNGAPRSYTVEAGKQLSGHWPANPAVGLYDLEVHGPNGFLRAFKGSTQGSPLSVRVYCDAERESLTLAIENRGHSTAHVKVFDQYRGENVSLELRPGNTVSRHWSLERQSGWYDLTVTVQGDSNFQRQFAGHIETGHASISDPRMGRVDIDN
jgi:phospholipase C